LKPMQLFDYGPITVPIKYLTKNENTNLSLLLNLRLSFYYYH
jgi:hypothetical protein